MTSALRTIVYVSTATMPMQRDPLEALLVESRDLNLLSGTTGALLCCDGNFMQCIEGVGEGLDETWARIRRSRRHIHVTELINEPVAERTFGDWQMGFFRTRGEGLLAQGTANWEEESVRLRPTACLQLLRQFWRNAR